MSHPGGMKEMSDPGKVKKEVEAWAVVYAFGEHSEIADSDSAALAVYEFEGTARGKIDSDSQRAVPVTITYEVER